MTMYPESSPGCVAADTPGIRLAFFSENFARGESKRQSAVITGKRGSGKPYQGKPQFTGQVVAAAYANQMGYLMLAWCGNAISIADPERVPDAAAVTQIAPEGDCAGRFVGIPCPQHGFVQDGVITIHGTENYDGMYVVERGTSEDVIAIEAPFVAETLTASARIYRGRAPLLEGEAVDLGGGKVGLPVRGNIHSLNTGDSIRIQGSFNYDGTYALTAQCGEGMLIVEAVFSAETFDGTVRAVPQFWRHRFVLPKKQPTSTLEKYLDFDEEAGAQRYQRFAFCKVNSFSYNLGGDDELQLTVDFAVGRQDDSDTPLDPDPVQPSAAPFDNILASIWVAGVRRGDVETGSFTNAMSVTARAAVGDRGQYSRMSEGDPECTASMQAFMEESDWQAMAKARQTLPFRVGMCGAAGDECWFIYPESEIDTPGQPITGKEGLMQAVSVRSFVDCKQSVLEFELINRVSAYVR